MSGRTLENAAVRSNRGRILLLLFGGVLILVGLALLSGGLYLAALGGSWYYLIVGLTIIAAGLFYIRGRILGAWLYGVAVLGTLAWALWEVGLTFWPLIPRLSGPLALAVPALLLVPLLSPVRRGAPWYGAAAGLTVALLGAFGAMFMPHGVIRNQIAQGNAPIPTDGPTGDWTYFGRTPSGTRFAPFDQINKENVSSLEVAWTFRTGEFIEGAAKFQNTPLQVGNTLYICTPQNKVFALDAETGREIWRFDAKPDLSGGWFQCRGLGYYDTSSDMAGTGSNNAAQAPGAEATAPAGQCPTRIVMSTVDARLLQLDARTGELCREFGNDGVVNLMTGMGDFPLGFYVPSSAPTVVRGRIIVGGAVPDNVDINVPSGVVRAFDARTGELAWVWDMGQPDLTLPLPEGHVFTKGTPNFWSHASFDEALGLLYVPTGNPSPDRWGGMRREFDEKYSSSIVALDIETGRVAWSFQTVHHDVWDLDNAPQPVLYDMPDGTPVVVQAGKNGQVFVLDRRTGQPVKEVEERPVPQGGVPDERLSPTQPFSVGMPQFGNQHLTEADMWGISPLDQLMCRIGFREMRYEGPYTPPGLNALSMVFPGSFGGINWGSMSVNEDTGIMIVNDLRTAQREMLVERETTAASSGSVEEENYHIRGGIQQGLIEQAQRGTPYAARFGMFLSPLGIPCQAPPFGTISGVDLNSGQLVWQIPAGTLADYRMGSLKVGLPIPLGMPTLGGSLSTRSGLVFFAGTQDYYLRALDQLSGKEIWRAKLPVGAIATPMSYVSPASGRQFVVINAGGTAQSTDTGDYVIAYALPSND
jgi:quinate dehydrogenase (quinone)